MIQIKGYKSSKKRWDIKKIISFIILTIFIVFIINFGSKTKNKYFQDDIIFFKLFDSKSEIASNGNSSEVKLNTNSKFQEKSLKNYNIKVKKKQKKSKNINLLQTIDSKTLVNEKVAPGTEGKFFINLSSNTDLNYKMEIIDKNIKPKNLKFYIDEPNGAIKAGEFKKVLVKWKWNYEINKIENIQDTKDGENLLKYEFEVCTIGE